MHTNTCTQTHIKTQPVFGSTQSSRATRFLKRHSFFLSCFSPSEKGTVEGGPGEYALFYVKGLTLLLFMKKFPLPFSLSGASLLSAAYEKQRAEARWLERTPDVATRDPSRCGLPKGTGSAPHPCVGRSKGGVCRDPCLCLDFKGSWALLKLVHAFHNQDMPKPSFAAGFLHMSPSCRGLGQLNSKQTMPL